MILIVSFLDNAHVDRVLEHLRRPFVVLDTAWFPARMRIDARFSAAAERRHVHLPDGRLLDLDDVGAVWCRRIRPLTLHDDLTDATARLFAWSEANEALLGLWYSLDCPWMNTPDADEISQRKIRQLQVARSLGIPIPETVITNDPATARAFLEELGPDNVVRKAFRNLAEAPRETSIVHGAGLALIDSVRYTPVIFQRFVPAALDLRVTIVEDEIFTAAVRSGPAYRADYRLGLASAEVFPYDLPDDVAAGLQRLMGVFGLRYGAIDMRVTPDGEHVFLEINPAGEYLFISDRTQQPIPAAIAAALERHDRTRPVNRSG